MGVALQVLLAGCQVGPAARVSPEALTVEARVTDSAPVLPIMVSLAGEPDLDLAVVVEHTSVAISGHAFGARTPTTLQVLLELKAPRELGGGVYQDTVTLRICADPACARQVPNSPLTVRVKLVVSSFAPTLTSLEPSSVLAPGRDQWVALHGANLFETSVVEWNGRPLRSFFNGIVLIGSFDHEELTVPGTVHVTAFNSGPGGGRSNVLDFEVLDNAKPVVLGLSPATVNPGGPGLTVQVEGQGFNSRSQVYWNATLAPATLLSPTRISLEVPAGELASAGVSRLTVFNPDAQVGSGGAYFTVLGPPSVSLSFPPFATVGSGPFTLDIRGTNLGPSTSVLWNGVPRPATWTWYSYQNEGLAVEVSAADLAAPGTVAVGLMPATDGGLSTPAYPFELRPP